MKKGFYFVQGNRGFFLVTDKQRKTDNIARAIIDAVATARNIAPEVIERAKADAATLKDFKYRTDAATLEKRTTESGYIYYTIAGQYFTANFPPEDFHREIVVIENT